MSERERELLDLLRGFWTHFGNTLFGSQGCYKPSPCEECDSRDAFIARVQAVLKDAGK